MDQESGLDGVLLNPKATGHALDPDNQRSSPKLTGEHVRGHKRKGSQLSGIKDAPPYRSARVRFSGCVGQVRSDKASTSQENGIRTYRSVEARVDHMYKSTPIGL